MRHIVIGVGLIVLIPFLSRWIYLSAYKESSKGMFSFDSELKGLGFLALVVVGTVFGVFSSLVLARAAKHGIERLFDMANSKQAFIGACVVAPAVVSGFYPQIAAIDSWSIVFLLAYQNGYFWENVTAVIGNLDK